MLMKLNTVRGLLFLALTFSLVAPTPAHHSFAMFDFEKTVSCPATVKEFRWTNPHVTLLIEAAPNPGDSPEVWSLELTSPGNLTRLGWTHSSFKPGDRIDIQFNPLRDGKHGGAFRQAKIQATGQVLVSSVRDANDAPNLK
ncbi:MAG TPA: DUF6152 family protein [Steroidobacteraceae bacterium]|nr:DUF6152 family protein [Steroidobacteraceae bacterium]